jgi:transposase
VKDHKQRKEPSVNKVSINGLDLAKTIFQVHGVDAAGEAALERRLRRSKVLGFFAEMEPCLIGMEACATAHYWARELTALGHEVRLMPPIYVKPYVQTAEERRGRRGGDLRGGDAALDALRAGEDGGHAGGEDAAHFAAAPGRSAHYTIGRAQFEFPSHEHGRIRPCLVGVCAKNANGGKSNPMQLSRTYRWASVSTNNCSRTCFTLQETAAATVS